MLAQAFYNFNIKPLEVELVELEQKINKPKFFEMFLRFHHIRRKEYVIERVKYLTYEYEDLLAQDFVEAELTRLQEICESIRT